MVLPNNDDNLLILKIVVEMKEALQGIETLRVSVNELKTAMRTLRESTGSSFDQIAKTIERNFEAGIDAAKAQIKDLKQQLKDLPKIKLGQIIQTESGTQVTISAADIAANAQQQKEINEQLTLQKTKLEELRSSLKLYKDISGTALREVKKEAQLAAQGYTQLGVAATSSATQISNAYTQVIASSTGVGSTVDELKTKLASLRQVTGESFNQVAASLGTALVNASKEATDEVRRLEAEIKKLQEATQTTTPGVASVPVDTVAIERLQQQLELAKQKAQEAEKRLLDFSKNVNPALQQLGATAVTAGQSIATLSSVAGQSAQEVLSSYQQSSAGIQNQRALIDSLKLKMIELQQQTGESFKLISSVMQRELAEKGRIALSTLRQELSQTNAQIKILQNQIANPPTGTSGADIAKMNVELLRLRSESEQARKAIDNLTKALSSNKSATQQAGQELSKASGQARLFGIALGDLNSVASVFFGITLSSIATQAIRGVANWLGEAATKGREFTQAMFQLEVGVRALRRSGIDITTSQMLDNLEKINEETGNLFSNFELIKGAGPFVNLIRDLGLARDEIFSLQKAIIQLAIINGRSMEDVQRTVALAISSGYTEGLQRLGVSINRLTIAEEANRIGFEGGYTALTEAARAQSTYNLIIQKSVKYADDLSEAQTKLFGQIQSTEAKITDTQASIGEAMLPAQLLWNKAILVFIKILSKIPFINAIASLSTMLTVVKALPAVWENAGSRVGNFGRVLNLLSFSFDGLADDLKGTKLFGTISKLFTDLAKVVKEQFSKIKDSIEDAFAPILNPIRNVVNRIRSTVNGVFTRLSTEIKNSPFFVEIRRSFLALQNDVNDFIARLNHALEFLKQVNSAFQNLKPIEPIISEFAGLGEIDVADISNLPEQLSTALEQAKEEITQLEEETAQERVDLAEDLQKDLLKIEQDGIADRIKIQRDYNKEVAELQREFYNDTIKLQQDLEARLSDIDIRLQFNLEEAQIKFDFDVQEAAIKFNEDVAKANQEFRQSEVDRERKYQEELLRLREDYLMNLEDALEARDARAVLHARREFILERNRAARENEINKEENKEGLEEDLRDAALRRAARIRELEFELAQRRAALQRQAEFDRAEAQRRYAQDVEELKAKLQREEYELFISNLEKQRDQEDAEKAAKIFRLLENQKDLEALQKHYDDRLRIIAEALVKEAEAAGVSYELLASLTETYLGPNGVIASTIAAMVDSIEKSLGRLRQLNVPTPTVKQKQRTTTNRNDDFEFATGGALVARKPTQVTFGEVPEVAIFSPLSEIHKLPELLGGLGVDSGNKAGSMTLRVALEDGLVAEIVDQSMDNVAEVIFERSRAREIT